jgi:uncharacterized damage-inducible protein DinB
MSAALLRLEQQLQRAFEGEAWHGPSVHQALAGISMEQAAAHPIPGAHSIWELVLHLAGTYRLVQRRLVGDGTELSPEEDWPAVQPPSEDAWRLAQESLARLNHDVRLAVRGFPEARLDEPLVEEAPYSAYTQFIGLTQHDLYHAGQIMLLRRALGVRG